MIAGNDRATERAAKLAEFRFERATIDELEQLESPIAGDGQHRPQRRFNPRSRQQRRVAGIAGRFTKYFRERFTKTAV